MDKNKVVSQLSLKYLFNPCTQMSEHKFLELLPIKSAKGVYLYDFNDKAYIDCISSWWVNIFGHQNEYIGKKLKEQIDCLEHIILAGFTHKPIVDLSKRLCEINNNNFQKCFFADNGSSAVEIALKMSFHKNFLQGKKKELFLSLSNSYHGETIAALSISDVGIYKNTYKDLLIKNIFTPVPSFNDSDFSSYLKALEDILKKYADKISAFIIEPLIQCAGNMNMYKVEYLNKAVRMAKEYDVDIIFDEIAVGFARTSTMFAYMQSDIVPDFLCLSKAISGGYLPLSVVMLKDCVYDEFYGDYKRSFLHSHSYTGNALACACANAVLDIFENEDVVNVNKIKSAYIFKRWQEFLNYKEVKNLRHCGMVFAFDVDCNINNFTSLIKQKALEKGLLLRPLAKTIYFMPPYIINNDEIDYVINNLHLILKEIL